MTTSLEVPWGLACIDTEGLDAVLRLVGEVDYSVVSDFERRQGGPVVVDAIDTGAVTFMSAAALGLMLRSIESSHHGGKTPVLRSSSRVVDHLLALVGLVDAFERPASSAQRLSATLCT